MRLDIEQVIDGARLGPLHWRVLFLCALVTLLDGYDIQAMAAATPTLAADWHVPPAICAGSSPRHSWVSLEPR